MHCFATGIYTHPYKDLHRGKGHSIGYDVTHLLGFGQDGILALLVKIHKDDNDHHPEQIRMANLDCDFDGQHSY